jgi:hypothetical protein
MNKPTGGRGKKASYQTTHVRVPEPLKADIERLINLFHEGGEPAGDTLVSFDDAVVLAKAVLRQKKSAKVSLEKLLTAIYAKSIEL